MNKLLLLSLLFLSACSTSETKTSSHDGKIIANIYITSEKKDSEKDILSSNTEQKIKQINKNKNGYAVTFIDNCFLINNKCNMKVKYRLKQPNNSYKNYEESLKFIPNNKLKPAHVLNLQTHTLELGIYEIEASYIDINRIHTFTLHTKFEIIN